MDRFARYAEYVPIASILVGFALIGLGWNGAAGLDYVQGQFPYLISGGLAGLAFVFFGAASMVVRAMRRGQTRQEEQLRELTEAIRKMAPAAAFGSEAPSQNGLVVVGRASFHMPTCRTLGARANLDKVPRTEAVEQGLEPCRVCNP